VVLSIAAVYATCALTYSYGERADQEDRDEARGGRDDHARPDAVHEARTP